MSIVRVALAGVLGLAALAGTTPARAGAETSVAEPPAVAVPVLRWTACYDGQVECTVANVPLDYDKPGGAKIRLALVRLPATDPSRRIGSLFLNPGGPGGSGVDFARAAAPFIFGDAVRARFDIVGFDPRGVWRSAPIRCFRSFREADDLYEGIPAFPVTLRDERRTLRAHAVYAGLCGARNPVMLRHMSTANVARDLDLLRRSVGDARLTFAGYSYGTYLAATYANLFPGKVRAVVADGVLDPVAWATGSGREGARVPVSTRLGSGESSWATMRSMLAHCDRAGARCAFSGGDPQRKFDALMARLRRGPVPLDPSGEAQLFYPEAVSGVTDLLYHRDAWSPLGAMLQEWYDASRRVSASSARPPFPEPQYDNTVDSFNAVTCSETANPDTRAAWPRAADAADRSAPHFGRYWTWQSARCADWPAVDADRFAGPFDRRTSAPMLVVGNRFDPSTPYAGALALDRVLPRSRLLTLDWHGHTSLGASACVNRHVERYLIAGTLPAKGTVCQADRRPFEPAPQEVLDLRAAIEGLRPGPYAG